MKEINMHKKFNLLFIVGLISNIFCKSNIELKHAFDKKNIVPLVIIGSGPAGLTAGMYGTRSGLYTVVFTGKTLGGQLTETSYVENWPGIKKTFGYEIMQTLQNQAESFGAILIEDTITNVDTSNWPYVLTTQSVETINALSIIIATGASARKLGIKGELDYWGKGVTACALCDCVFFKGKDVVIVGGGDAAIEEAIQLATYAKTVTILVRSNRMRAVKSMQDKLRDYDNIKIIYNKQVTQIIGDGKSVTGIEIKDIESNSVEILKAQGLFLAIGQNPNTELFNKSIKLNKDGYIEIEPNSQATSVCGIFAAGDVEDAKFRQAVVAASHGCKAALEAISWLRDLGLTEGMSKRLAPSFFDVRSVK